MFCVLLQCSVCCCKALENPELTQYDVLIVDEAHERHTSTDLLLSYIRRLLKVSAFTPVI